MERKRVKIVRAAQGKGGNSRHNAGIKRFANDRARRLKKSLIQQKRGGIGLKHSTLMQDRVASPLLDRIDTGRPASWKRVISRRYQSTPTRLSLENFNFLDDPIGTIETLHALSRVESEEFNACLDFNDSHCDDIGAFLVVAEIWQQLSPVFQGGKMNKSVQKVFDAVGLRSELRIGLPAVDNHRDIWPFPIRRRRPTGTTRSPTAQLRPQGRERLNDELIELMNEWLAVASEYAPGVPDDIEWSLTGDGKAHIANMIGEVLDNAERHSAARGDGDWSMAAFMARRDKPGGGDAMKCYIAFLSVGRSIAETIETAPAPTREFCERYARHARPGQSRETLLTIAALQDGVTSNDEAFKAGRGGTGLQDTLALVSELGGAPNPDADVRLTIVSGKSCIRLRHPILLGKQDAKGRRVQWCNATNDPTYPPDRDIAFDLPAHFSGTLVSVAFTLDPGLFVPEGEPDGKEDD